MKNAHDLSVPLAFCVNNMYKGLIEFHLVRFTSFISNDTLFFSEPIFK